MEKTYDLADCIPKELIEEIRINGKEQYDQLVYRVAKRGIIDEIAFMNSFDECLYENRENNNDLNDIGSYSTSCYTTPKHPQKFLKCLKKKHFDKFPQPSIILGNTICGLSQQTAKRKAEYPYKEHIDWWIYKNSFKEVCSAFSFFEDIKQEGLKNE